jgi:hypothetical protein
MNFHTTGTERIIICIIVRERQKSNTRIVDIHQRIVTTVRYTYRFRFKTTGTLYL